MAKKRGTKVGIEGGKEIVAKFERIGREAQNEIEQALVRCGLRVERDAKKGAPVDSGRLRNSITHRLIDSETDQPVVEVGTNVEYAKFVEQGTSKQPAQPFLLTAYLGNRKNILKELAKAVKKGAGL